MSAIGAVQPSGSPPPASSEERYTGEGFGPPAPLPLDTSTLVALAGIEMSDTNSRSATRRLESAQSNQKHALQAARRAIEKAKQKAEQGGFWSDVGKIAKITGAAAAVVGGVAAAGVSGGSSLVIAAAVAGAVLSTGSIVMQETGLDTDVSILGKDIKASTFLAVGGAALSAGGAVGAACSGAGAAAQGGSQGWKIASGAAQATSAGASGTRGVATIQEGRYMADAAELRADARGHELQADDSDRIAKRSVELIGVAAEARSRAMQAIAGFVNTREDAKRIAMGVKA